MPWWAWLLDAVAVVLLLCVCYAVTLVVRRRLLARHGGTFELSHRVRSSKAGRGWVLGVGRYHGDRLEWFRVFSPNPRPTKVWGRKELIYQGRRERVGGEQISLYADHLVIVCHTTAGETVELALTRSSLLGLQAWLEARPPGTNWTEAPLR
ncbi:DUF2550 domain-containing protein [Nocardioides limicola]|uniref:DUF2550 domain-containing protein n=1 Tax=Nocardioides limicola TaxID=2803368 RepID=UPI00193B6D53|nr:DUF2550 domain-containing protein [Nocardioides sp. DJM-14]